PRLSVDAGHGLERLAEATDAPRAGAVGHSHLLAGPETERPLEVVAVAVGQLGRVEVRDEGVGRRHRCYLNAERIFENKRVSAGATSSPRSAAKRRRSSSCSGS